MDNLTFLNIYMMNKNFKYSLKKFPFYCNVQKLITGMRVTSSRFKSSTRFTLKGIRFKNIHNLCMNQRVTTRVYSFSINGI